MEETQKILQMMREIFEHKKNLTRITEHCKGWLHFRGAKEPIK